MRQETEISIALDDLRPEDVGAEYVAWLNDPVVMRFTEARFQPQTLETVREYVRRTNASATDRIWRIMADGRHVGNVRLSGIQPLHRRASLSIIIGDRAIWGRGVATRAIKLASEAGFGTMSLNKIGAGIYQGNAASVHAFEKAGYHQEAILSENRLFEGCFVDEILMARFNGRAA